MATVVEKKKYRDELVQLIKDVGQELIDRAEDMVGENTDAITDFSIDIYFPQGVDLIRVPEIHWTTEVISKNVLKRQGYKF